MGRRVLILAAGIGSGHNIAAGVLESCFQAAPEVDAVQKLDVLESTNEVYRALYDDGYFALVEAVPWLVGWGYDESDAPFRLAHWVSLWDRINTTATAKAIKAFRPDIIVCTHFLPTRLVSLMLTRGVLEARLAVVTTDYDFQGLWLSSPFNHIFVARNETKAHMAAIGVPADRITVSGIPVRPGLGDAVDREAVLTRYGLRPDRPTLLISAGAAGGVYTQTIVQQTLRMGNDFQAVVVCGRNDQLKSQIEGLVAFRDRYRVLGYTTDMPDLVRTATLFVGKPGGLSSSECMAAGLPMVLIHPIPGQEVRNSDFLLEEGAAVRCNYETTVGYKIDQLLAEPGRITRMAENARRIGRPEAGPQVTSAVLGDESPPLWISHAAQKSVLSSSERGIAAANLYAGRRVRTLINAPTGQSAGVITTAQLDSLLPARAGGAPSGANLSLSAEQISNLRRRTEPGLMFTLRRILDKASDLRLELRP
jgi:processive 1,2-diacylglycerol beta-glucosyltransferase